MGQTIACANQKGGVGKTTTVVNLATYLALDGQRVLVIDLDSQGNTTSGLGIDKSLLERSIYDAVIDSVDLVELTLATAVGGLSIIPAAVELAGAEVELAPLPQRERRLARLIAPIADRYDLIFLDCPPSLGLLTVNALTAATSVLIPIQCEYYALEGLTQLIATINLVRDNLNPGLVIQGVVLTMVDPRTNLSAEVSAEVRRHMRGAVYDVVIPRNVRLSEAPSYGLPIALYSPESKGAEAYRALAVEFLARVDPATRSQAAAHGSGNPVTVRADRRQSGLGRGLAALIPQRPASAQSGQLEIAVDRIQRNPYQPRKRIDQEALEQLTASVREHGVIQPILVIEILDGYQLVAGERRLRAAQLAGLERIPAVVRQLADREQLELALVENLQRADLNPLEEALAFRQLIDEFGFTQEQLSLRLGRARSTVANTLRLLDMSEAVKEAVADGRISEGHARAMAGLSDRDETQLLELITARDLSVRQTEELTRRLRPTDDSVPALDTSEGSRTPDPDLQRVEEELRQALGTKVSLARSRRGGRIVIEYYSDEELSRLYERLVGGAG